MGEAMGDHSQHDSQSKRNRPESYSVAAFEKDLERGEVVFDTFLFQSTRDFESGDQKKDANTSDAAH